MNSFECDDNLILLLVCITIFIYNARLCIITIVECFDINILETPLNSSTK